MIMRSLGTQLKKSGRGLFTLRKRVGHYSDFSACGPQKYFPTLSPGPGRPGKRGPGPGRPGKVFPATARVPLDTRR